MRITAAQYRTVRQLALITHDNHGGVGLLSDERALLERIVAAPRVVVEPFDEYDDEGERLPVSGQDRDAAVVRDARLVLKFA